MGRRKKRVEEVEEEGTPSPAPVATILWGATAVAFSFIIYNVFLGQPEEAVRMARDAAESRTVAGTVTRKGNQNTVILRYDSRVEEIQRELLALGHYKGMVDGVIGQNTREAISSYQRDTGLPVTGELTQDLLDRIRYARKLSEAAKFTGSTGQAPAVQDKRIALIQRALSAMGYDAGDETGVLNGRTRNAISSFERDNNLPVDGEIDREFLTTLARIAETRGLIKTAR